MQYHHIALCIKKLIIIISYHYIVPWPQNRTTDPYHCTVPWPQNRTIVPHHDLETVPPIVPRSKHPNSHLLWKFIRYNWYNEEILFLTKQQNCNLNPMVDASMWWWWWWWWRWWWWWWWSSCLDSIHFWRWIRVNPSFSARLLYTIFEASPPEALFVSRKSGESNHPCLGSDGQNVGNSWTHGNQGYSYSGHPSQADPRTSVTSISYDV